MAEMVPRKLLLTTSCRHLALALTAFLCGAAVAAAAPALPRGGGVIGTVTDTEGRQLESVAVVVEGPDGPIETITDKTGRFRFETLKPGAYHLKVNGEGFSEASYSPVTVRFGRLTTIRVQLSQTLDEILVVATEPPAPTPLPAEVAAGDSEIDRVGVDRDPFTALNQVVGVRVDPGLGRDAVAGEGADNDNNIFFIDGVEGRILTGVPASGRLEVRTGGGDVTQPNPGVLINLTTPESSSQLRFDAELTVADRSWQESSNLQGVGLADAQGTDPAAPGRVDNLVAWGGDAGGSVIEDRLWLWGTLHRRELEGAALGGTAQRGELEHGALKVQGRPWQANSFTLSGHRSERRNSGIGAAPDREIEATQTDYAPSTWLKLEDSQLLRDDLQLTLQLSETRDGLGLTPAGSGDIFLDSGGVWHGGWLERSEEVDASTVQLDAALALRSRRGQHELRAGWRQRDVESRQLQRWGNDNTVVLAGENYGTGFDLVRVHRSGDLALDRQLQAGWLQDRVTFSGVGEWSLDYGLRFDQQLGRSLGGSAESNPLLPDLLPAVEDPSGQQLEFTDLLPRFAAAWTPGDAWNTTVRWGWSRFASRLREDLLERVSPLASSEVTLGFEDLDADRRFDGSEPFIVLDRQGADHFASSSASFAGDRGLRSELTDEWRFGIQARPAHALELRLDVVRREVSRVFDAWRLVTDGESVRVAQVSDYSLDTIYGGLLPDGTPYSAPVYSLDEGLQFTGGSLIQNGDRRQVYEAVTLGLTRRLSGGMMIRAHATWSDWTWRVTKTFAAYDDPTDSALGDLDGVDDDGAAVAQAGADDRWIHGRWSFDLLAMVQVARNHRWGFDVSAHVHGREGSPIPYSLSVVSEDRLREVQVTPEIDTYRLEDVLTVDLRLEKAIFLGNTQAVFSLDVFNLLDEGYVLERQAHLSSPQADLARATLSPRVVQLGVRLALR